MKLASRYEFRTGTCSASCPGSLEVMSAWEQRQQLQQLSQPQGEQWSCAKCKSINSARFVWIYFFLFFKLFFLRTTQSIYSPCRRDRCLQCGLEKYTDTSGYRSREADRDQVSVRSARPETIELFEPSSNRSSRDTVRDSRDSQQHRSSAPPFGLSGDGVDRSSAFEFNKRPRYDEAVDPRSFSKVRRS